MITAEVIKNKIVHKEKDIIQKCLCVHVSDTEQILKEMPNQYFSSWKMNWLAGEKKRLVEDACTVS